MTGNLRSNLGKCPTKHCKIIKNPRTKWRSLAGKRWKLNRVAMFDTGGSTWINHPPIPAAGPKTCDHVHHQLGRELGPGWRETHHLQVRHREKCHPHVGLKKESVKCRPKSGISLLRARCHYSSYLVPHSCKCPAIFEQNTTAHGPLKKLQPGHSGRWPTQFRPSKWRHRRNRGMPPEPHITTITTVTVPMAVCHEVQRSPRSPSGDPVTQPGRHVPSPALDQAQELPNGCANPWPSFGASL